MRLRCNACTARCDLPLRTETASDSRVTRAEADRIVMLISRAARTYAICVRLSNGRDHWVRLNPGQIVIARAAARSNLQRRPRLLRRWADYGERILESDRSSQ
jgi:hypothetical protein